MDRRVSPYGAENRDDGACLDIVIELFLVIDGRIKAYMEVQVLTLSLNPARNHHCPLSIAYMKEKIGGHIVKESQK